MLYSYVVRSEAFVGRRAELTHARGLLARLDAGNGGALVVVGEPGIGKTRLLDEIAGLVGPEQLVVARAECLPLRTPLPFEPVLELLRSLRRAGVDDVALPAEGTAGSGLFTAVVAAIERAAAARPVLLMVDDLQFSDAGSWVLATRPGKEVEALLHHLQRGRLATRLDLDALAQDELRELMADRLGGALVDEDVAAAIRVRSEGNAFFAEELLRMLLERGALPAEHVERVIPPSVTDAVRERARQLPAQTRAVLAWASLVPTIWVVPAGRPTAGGSCSPAS